MSAVLLVTGARALADTVPAECWARDAIDAALFARDWYGVAHGGARGPDTWADVAALRLGLHRVAYRLDGTITEDERAIGAWRLPDEVLTEPTPLARNRGMVDALARIRDVHDVYALALRAGWSRTQGTMHTARLAVAAGIPTWICECPREFGPQGGRR